jgi:hypothetical protein
MYHTQKCSGRADRVAQAVQPSKHEALSSNSSITKTKSVVVSINREKAGPHSTLGRMGRVHKSFYLYVRDYKIKVQKK